MASLNFRPGSSHSAVDMASDTSDTSTFTKWLLALEQGPGYNNGKLLRNASLSMLQWILDRKSWTYGRLGGSVG